MPEPAYMAAALAAAVVITVALRTVPFLAKNTLRESALLDDLGRWMPLGAVTILAVYCLTQIAPDPHEAAGPLTGVAVTIATHLWRHNAVLSIVTGTSACLLVTNLLH